MPVEIAGRGHRDVVDSVGNVDVFAGHHSAAINEKAHDFNASIYSYGIAVLHYCALLQTNWASSERSIVAFASVPPP